MVDAQDVFAEALPIEVALVATEAAEADATSEDVVNRHPALENENEVLPYAGRVCCGCSLFLTLPVVLVLSCTDVAHSRQVFDIWLDTTT